MNYSDKTVGGLFQNLDCEFNYTNQTIVQTKAEWEAIPVVVTKTVLSPSVKEKGAKVSVNFYDDPQRITPTLTPKDVNVTMKRNELTVLRYVYDDGKFVIYILVNDNWEMLHGMEID